MKKIFLLFAAFLLSFCFLSAKTFAQDVPGGAANAGGVIDFGGTSYPVQPIATEFTRNNGDGTCGGEAQIRLYFSQAPTIAPVLNEIWYQDSPLYSNFQPVTGDLSTYATTGYVSFCLTASNIPPAIKLTLDIIPSVAQAGYSISGTN